MSSSSASSSSSSPRPPSPPILSSSSAVSIVAPSSRTTAPIVDLAASSSPSDGLPGTADPRLTTRYTPPTGLAPWAIMVSARTSPVMATPTQPSPCELPPGIVDDVVLPRPAEASREYAKIRARESELTVEATPPKVRLDG